MCKLVAFSLLGAIAKQDTGGDETFRVLYLFSGRRRQNSVKDYLLKEAPKRNLKIEINDLDLLNGADLLNRAGQRKLAREVQEGRYSLVMGSPPLRHIF